MNELMSRIRRLTAIACALCVWAWAGSALAAGPTGGLLPNLSGPAESSAPARETDCSDGKDNDGDTVYDCGDHDCHDDPVCQPSGKRESSDELCGDWVDNDKDGHTDCDDLDCDGTDICKGSWDKAAGQVSASGDGSGTDNGSGNGSGNGQVAIGDGSDGGLTGDEAPEDLIGRGQDADGERNNYSCSDGIDNDGDGQIDCADIGCRLDTQVTVCQPGANFRFSVVARAEQSYNLQPAQNESPWNTEFTSLQLRVLGQMPFIQNSFFLISARAEKTPRVTFATFQVPIRKGHYVNVNSGGGGLSLELIRSTHKRMLADPAFYVYNAFEQGNGAALEFGGPLSKNGKFWYRTFVAGGSGRFAGNIGGTFFPDNNRNYTWTVGAQAQANVIGYYNRFDSPFLFTKVPTTLTFILGAKYDQRAQERYPAANAQAIFRWRRLIWMAEFYGKRELNFQNWQYAWNTQIGVLAVQKRLFFAGDVGMYRATDFERLPADIGDDLRRQQEELQYRFAAHVYLWRDVFYASLVWRDRRLAGTPAQPDPNLDVDIQQDVRAMVTYRW